MEELDELIAAVEAGEGVSSSLLPRGNEKVWPQIYLAYAGSLDAAKALHEALLPNDARKMGYFITLGFAGCAIIHGGHNDQLPEDIESGENIHKDNPARAWLIAILKAHRHNLAKGETA